MKKELLESTQRMMHLVGMPTIASAPADWAPEDLVEMNRLACDEIERLRRRDALAVAVDVLDEGFDEHDFEQAKTHPAEPLLRDMLGTYSDRRSTYGPSEQAFARVAMAHFPNGLTLKTHTDWLRYGLLHMILSKLARYTHQFHAPHIDSIHDCGPYSAMLEAEDRRMLGMPPFRHTGT